MPNALNATCNHCGSIKSQLQLNVEKLYHEKRPPTGRISAETIREIATLTNSHPNTVYKYIRQAAGYSPKEYIKHNDETWWVCKCPKCGVLHKVYRWYTGTEKEPLRKFCRPCRELADNDYSNGMGIEEEETTQCASQKNNMPS